MSKTSLAACDAVRVTMWCPAEERGPRTITVALRDEPATGGSARIPDCCGCGWRPGRRPRWPAPLAILSLLTRATGQPLTVALLGVVITMIAARSVNEPDPHQQRITMALLPRARRAVHHRRRAARAAPDRRRCGLRGDRVRRGLHPPLRAARQGAGHGRVHGLLLHPVSAGQAVGAALADRGRRGGNGVHVRDERLRAARSTRTRAARHHSGAAGADGHRHRHHRRSGAHRPPRRTATPPTCGPAPSGSTRPP